MTSRRVRPATAAYGLLVRLFPPVLRHRYGPEMVDAFARELARRIAEEGGWSGLRFFGAACLDAVGAGLGARWRAVRRSEAAGRARSIRASTLTGGWLEDWGLDLRFALRGLRRNPTFTVVAVLTMAIGMAGTSTMLSVTDGLLFRQPPVDEPDRMVSIWELRNGRVRNSAEGRLLPWARYEAYRRATGEVFEDLASHAYGRHSVATDDGGFVLSGFVTSGNYFEVLGVRPGLGRLYDADDEELVVLSDRVWRRNFGADPDVVGRRIVIDSRAFTVVGVAAPDFVGTMAGFTGDVWMPAPAHARAGGGDTEDVWVVPIGRLRQEAEREGAEQRVAEIARSIEPESGGTTIQGARLEDLLWRESFRGTVAAALAIMMAAAAAMLLIACVNIAAMTLAVTEDRRREVAVRLAIGAGHGRLVRQMVTESVLLALLGGALGWVMATVATGSMSSIVFPVDVTITLDVTPGVRILLASIGITILTGLLFGIGPALWSARTDLTTSLKEAPHGRRATRRKGAYVVGQLALSTVLLVASGLLLRSFTRVLNVPLGFDPEGVLTATITLDNHGYGRDEARLFYRRLMEQVRAIPGVEAAGLGTFVLLGGGDASSTGAPVDGDDGPRLSVGYNIVDSGYFAANGVELVAGRLFTDADAEGERRVAVVNQRLAERFWPGQSALGKIFETDRVHEVVGVVRDGVYAYQYEEPRAFAYYSFAQRYSTPMALHVRVAGEQAAVATAIRTLLGDLDPDLAVSFRTMDDVVAWSQFGPRFLAGLTTVFAGIGFLLATVGVYGMLAVQVARRVREFGVRLAVGARARDVMLRVIARGATSALFGCVLGLAVSLAGGRLLGSLLYQTSPFDPVTFLVVPLVLIAAAVAASAVPARRAARVSPTALLREE